MSEPTSELLRQWARVLTPETVHGPVLDVACGDGRNGIFLARQGLDVICCDLARPSLRQARAAAQNENARIRLWWTDLEAENRTLLPENAFGAVLVFRYLHRPLMAEIRSAVRPGGYVIYETFTEDQARFGPPRNPEHLLRKGELAASFADWDCLHVFEGELQDPRRAMAQLVARRRFEKNRGSAAPPAPAPLRSVGK